MKPSTLEDLIAYRDHGQPPGDFINAVLENNLIEAFRCADAENTEDMHEIVSFVYNEMPCGCYGSAEAIKKWIEKKLEQRAGLT